MTGAVDPGRLRLLAAFAAGRSVDVATAPAGVPAHTDGRVVFVSAGADADRQRREVLLHSALLGAGSLAPEIARALRGRRALARRYLAIEGRRVLGALADRVPVLDRVDTGDAPLSGSPDESLRIARSATPVGDPPEWFGEIAPARLVPSTSAPHGGRAKDDDLHLRVRAADIGDDDDPDDDPDDEDGATHRKSRILKLFETPVVMSELMANALRKLLGTGRAPGDDDAGGALTVSTVRRAQGMSTVARPRPTAIRFTDDGSSRPAVGVAGAWFPEWDVHEGRYRPDWCRVVDYPAPRAAPGAPTVTAVPHDDVLRRRLARISLGPRRLRRRADGDELDIEALVDVFVDLQSGYSPPEHVYTESRMTDRTLSVLILLDASGSVDDSDPDGLAVHDHQRRAANTIATTLEDLGDRVAVYAFRSQGRQAVHLPAIKTFDERFGAAARTALTRLQPSGYTRLGAGIRGAGEILKARAGTPKRLLLVLSDGFPYDHGYEGRYAEADAARALDELRADGVACLCLSLGPAPDGAALERVFGGVGHAKAATLGDLSPRMDELFGSALAELSAPASRGSAGR